MTAPVPTLAVTVGDPRGIGPEIIRAALASSEVRERCTLCIIGPDGVNLPIDECIGAWAPSGNAARDLEHAGALSGAAIARAVEIVQAGRAHAVVTAPIDKAALLAGGYDYPGHTEMLAALTGSRVAMMLASDVLRVVLATTHIPLRDVPASLSQQVIGDVAATTREGLSHWFGIASPRIALCALNPHAGDRGRFGDEDDTVLTPAARAHGLAGPFPADTVFVRAMRGEFDAVIAPYHDVGMTAIKVASFGKAVNITLGLPFIRTSPDHGTALDIAGQGIADPSSFIQATRLAAHLSARWASPLAASPLGDLPSPPR